MEKKLMGSSLTLQIYSFLCDIFIGNIVCYGFLSSMTFEPAIVINVGAYQALIMMFVHGIRFRQDNGALNLFIIIFFKSKLEF